MQGDVGYIDCVLPPVIWVKIFDPQFSPLTLELGQKFTLTLDQNLTMPTPPEI